MPITDSYGQNISLTNTATDAPDLGRGIQDLAAGVIPRSILRFVSASARGATITSPVAGMQAWLDDVKQMTVYDGAAWVTSAVGTAAWTNISLNTSRFAHNGNANGNAQYRVVSLFGERTIMLRGAVSCSWPAVVDSQYLLTGTPLPTGARPTTLRTINIPCSDVGSTRISLKLDIQTDGHLQIFGTNSSDKPVWIGLNGTFCSL
ncbi:hypothetical protein [Streptomyces sp. STCH 565 A]|uniref:hypothetical protein n=1 Tax=Streptomyces sp. STCH 565 A TaxID=2950532 RepID=UPI0020758DAB|nr:hypothetical protein [Streptomyces sp. STCH 565 A]MCM8548879.1 hypothetical protein [Streptomyces sp. STCH 565 A]